MRALLSEAAPDCVQYVDQSFGQSALNIASCYGRVGVVRELLGASAVVDQLGDHGTSPLIVASQRGQLEVVRVLLGASAVVDRPNNEGSTTLYMASQDGELEVMRVLLGASAVVDQPDNNDGCTALFIYGVAGWRVGGGQGAARRLSSGRSTEA